MIIKILWTIATVFLFLCGIYYSFLLKGKHFKIERKKEKKTSNNGVRPYESLMMSIAAKVGVGSLAGVALAIYYGGMGTIFWIWISSFITSANAYAEAYLGTKYSIKKKKEKVGGPSYYIKNKRLSKLYAVLLFLTYVFGFISIQTNTIVTSIVTIFSIKKILLGIILSILIGIIIFKNTKILFQIISKMVPIMSLGYMIIGMLVIMKNASFLPIFFHQIIIEAFSKNSIGIGFFSALLIGIQRGIFSTEAGIGTGAIASSAAVDTTPQKQGRLQVLGTLFISLVIVTLTAFFIASSPIDRYSSSLNGIEITQTALKYHFGSIGEIILMIAILFFATSTILAGFYYGKTNLEFLFPSLSVKQINLYRILVIGIILLGSILKSKILWNVTDAFIALLAIINSYGLFSLRKEVK